ncbi:unnamed protein product [Prorocentrum cordatum]|uniref:Uncharacterized protein n=1 Tax=Prorocentrum cordatum TaxID=2364126 RepID=A0ABN9UAU6_9DINO|nr:unnamed protein product [Polarella glacialis]
MSNGELVQAHDVAGNDLVDDLAKQTARRGAIPRAQVQLVRAVAARLRDAAVWIGRTTVYANRCTLDVLAPVDTGSKRQCARDSEAEGPRRARGCKGKAAPADGAREPGGQAAQRDVRLAPPSGAGRPAGGQPGRPAAAATCCGGLAPREDQEGQGGGTPGGCPRRGTPGGLAV